MIEGFGTLFSTLTGRIPTDFISPITGSWTIEVLETQDLSKNEPKDWFQKYIKDPVAGFFSYVGDKIAGWLGNTTSEKWVAIAEFDSFISLNGKNDSQIVDNAVESGSFRSVNKIIKPSTFTVELGKGGWKAGIEKTIKILQKYQNSTVLCRIVTPFSVIKGLNLMSLSYTFTRDDGANLLIAKLDFKEVRSYNKRIKRNKEYVVKSPSNSDTVNGGVTSMSNLEEKNMSYTWEKYTKGY